MSTLVDVATLAGVSKATASRALSHSELVAPETAARVFGAAEMLGFVPNRAARQLARGRTGVIALVVPTLENSFFTPIIAGAQSSAVEHDLQLTVAVNPLSSPSDLTAFERLSRQVDGFIVAAPRGDDEIVRAACGVTPTVLVDREVEGVASVVADTATAFGSLVSRLIADGHERLVYLGGPAGSWQDVQRTAAVVSAAHEVASLAVLGPYPSTFAAGVAAAPEVVSSGATAAVPYATAIGLGLMFALGRGDGSPSPAPAPVTVSSERMVVDSLGLVGVPAIDVDGDELGRVALNTLVTASRGASASPVRLRLPVPVYWPSTS